MARQALLVLLCAGVLLGCERRPRGVPGRTEKPRRGPSPAVLSAPDRPAAETPKLDPPFSPLQPPLPVVVDRPGRQTGRYGGTLSLVSASDPSTFNPRGANDGHTAAMLPGAVYAPLVRYDRESFKVEPLLARTWDRTEDGRTWTFQLREGLMWSDGSPLTAADVVFTFQAAMDPAVGSPDRDLLMDNTGDLPDVTAKSDRTVVFSLKGVHVLFPEAVASIHLLPHRRWEKAWREGRLGKVLGPDTPPDSILASGPFRVRRYVPGKLLELERNAYSALTDAKGHRLPYLDRVVWHIVADYDQAVRRFLAGEIDVYDQVRPTDFDQLKRGEAEGRYTVLHLGASHGVSFVAFNLHSGTGPDGKPVVEEHRLRWVWDKRFRRAVSHAIDRQALVDKALQGRGRPVRTIVTEANRAWQNPVAETEYSPEKARSLLAEAGFTDRNRDGILEDAGGRRITFELATSAGDSLRQQAAQLVAADLRRVGIGVDVRPMPFPVLVERLTHTSDWQAVLMGLGGNVPPDPAMWNSVYLSGGRHHAWHPRQDKPATAWERQIDQHVGTLTGTHDFLLRKAAHDKILDILAEEQPMVFLYAPDVYVAGRVRVGNLRPSPLRPHGIWNIEELFLVEGS